MEYGVYHDESQEAGYWHGILLVPRATRQRFLDHLQEIRQNTSYQELVRLKGLDRTTGPRYRCTRAWLHFGVAALMQNLKGKPFHFYTGNDGRNTDFARLSTGMAPVYPFPSSRGPSATNRVSRSRRQG